MPNMTHRRAGSFHKNEEHREHQPGTGNTGWIQRELISVSSRGSRFLSTSATDSRIDQGAVMSSASNEGASCGPIDEEFSTFQANALEQDNLYASHRANARRTWPNSTRVYDWLDHHQPLLEFS